MGAIVFNVAKGRLARYADLTAAGDELVAVLLSTAEADATLQDYDTLAALLAGSNTEATFTGYSQQTLANVAVTVDDSGNTVKVDCDDPQWSPTSAQALAKIVFCYDPDGSNTAASMIPLFADDFSATTPTSGTVTYNVATGGFYSAS